MMWSSEALYGGRVSAAPSVAKHSIADIAAVTGNPDATVAAAFDAGFDVDDVAAAAIPLVLVDTAGCGMEEIEEEGGSRRNDGEAAVAVAIVKEHVAMGICEADIGIITPYSAQRARWGCRLMLHCDDIAGLRAPTLGAQRLCWHHY
jgi:ATP-dependent RNA/DNA helicase IGHMBP2